MVERFDVQIDTLRAAASTFAREVPQLEDARRRLQSQLDQLSDPWGDNQPGPEFASVYDPNARALQGALSTLVDSLGSIGKSLATMADQYEASDTASQMGNR